MKRMEIIAELRNLRGPVQVKAEAIELLERDAERIYSLRRNLADARNELCFKCGKYHMAYIGSCDGCRWAEDSEWML